MRCLHRVWLGVLFCASVGLAASQTLKQAQPLLDKPAGSPQGAPVAQGTAARIVERQGFWVRVEAVGQTGWLKASSLSFASAAVGPVGLDTGRLGSGNIVSTSAARGLSSKDLLDASPRPGDVRKLAQYVPDAQEVQAFMRQGQVTPTDQPVQLKVAAQSGGQPAAGGAPASGPAPTDPRRTSDAW